MDVDSDAQEYSCVTFEWKLKGLKALFESTRGETKSKVARSGKFDNGRWQILFYANAGVARDPGCPDGYVSLYLSCDPTTEEREAGLIDSGGHGWVREGTYKFSFEIKNVEKTSTYSSKEAINHTFSSRTANWGWAQFARRDLVYFNCPAIRGQDAMLITCSVMSSPRTPPSAPIYPYLPAPKDLLQTIGSLLDDPLYSDVQFVFPRRNEVNSRRIYASKRMLSRIEYYAMMFKSDFVEGNTPRLAIMSLNESRSMDSCCVAGEFEDSDEEDDDDDTTTNGDSDCEGHSQSTSIVGSEDNPRGDGGDFSVDNRGQDSPRSRSPEKKEVQNETRVGSEIVPPGPSKTTIVVKDVAYRTYKAILYWLYTDHIVFAPLTSSFNRNMRHHSDEHSGTSGQGTQPVDASMSQLPGSKRSRDLPASRADWIREWTKEFPNRPEPCSAKAVYKVADKIDIPELKERAAQHIIKSLNVDNVAYEVFSPFSAMFDDIRKIEITFFLDHWNEIRSSECMVDIWRQIRAGRHPGFEEVWPLITRSLEFRPSSVSTPSASQAPTRYYSENFV